MFHVGGPSLFPNSRSLSSFCFLVPSSLLVFLFLHKEISLTLVPQVKLLNGRFPLFLHQAPTDNTVVSLLSPRRLFRVPKAVI